VTIGLALMVLVIALLAILGHEAVAATNTGRRDSRADALLNGLVTEGWAWQQTA
jgi:hypothetical protein